MSTAPQASHRIAGGELLTAAARTLELVMQVAAACQGGMSAREGEIEFLAHVIAEAGGHARLRPVVIDQAGDVRMRLLAHYDQAEQISAGTRAAAALVDRWTLSLAYGDDELPREVTAAISACIGSCVAVAVSLAAATDAITPTAAALARQPSLLTEAGPAVGMCRRFILAAHGSLTGLVDDLESAGRLCRSSPVLRLVDGGTS